MRFIFHEEFDRNEILLNLWVNLRECEENPKI